MLGFAREGSFFLRCRFLRRFYPGFQHTFEFRVYESWLGWVGGMANWQSIFGRSERKKDKDHSNYFPLSFPYFSLGLVKNPPF